METGKAEQGIANGQNLAMNYNDAISKDEYLA